MGVDGVEDDVARLSGDEERQAEKNRFQTEAADGDSFAAWRLAMLCAEQGDLDGEEQALRLAIAIGDDDLIDDLADLTAKRGDVHTAERLRHFGLDDDGAAAAPFKPHPVRLPGTGQPNLEILSWPAGPGISSAKAPPAAGWP